jgi:SAM-dependent methyltransferase
VDWALAAATSVGIYSRQSKNLKSFIYFKFYTNKKEVLGTRGHKMTKKGLLKFTLPSFSTHKTRPEPEFVAFAGNLAERGKMLDIGCGIGLESDYAQKLGFEVVAIDKDYGCIRKAKEINQTVDFRQIDFFNYIKNISQSEFMLIVDSKFSNKLTQEQLEKYYKNISKVLKFGGYMYLQALSTDDDYCKKHCPQRKWTKINDNYIKYFSKQELLDLLHLTGLKVESFKTIKQKHPSEENGTEETYHIIVARQIVKKWEYA